MNAVLCDCAPLRSSNRGTDEAGTSVTKRTKETTTGKGNSSRTAVSLFAGLMGPDIPDLKRLELTCAHLRNAGYELSRLKIAKSDQVLVRLTRVTEALTEVLEGMTLERRHEIELYSPTERKALGAVLGAFVNKLQGPPSSMSGVAVRLRANIETALANDAKAESISTLIARSRDVHLVIPKRFWLHGSKPKLVGPASPEEIRPLTELIQRVLDHANGNTTKGRTAAAERIVKMCAKAGGLAQKKAEALFQHSLTGLKRRPGQVKLRTTLKIKV
jgi:hypothetical protein